MHHSGRVLQGLSFQPSGAIVAAATTSLPEGVGGERNWDYRYSWVRDASFTMEALWVAACPDEADDFFAFMTTAAASSVGPGQALQIMFGVGGEHDLTERELPHLAGWRDSRPVRVGNGAWNQQQIDVYGELLGAAHRLADQLDALDDDTRPFLVACADTAADALGREGPGHLGGPRRAAALPLLQGHVLGRAGPRHRAGRPVSRRPTGSTRWKRHPRRDLPSRSCRDGWSDSAGAFTQYVGSDEPRRVEPDDADRRVPAGRRPADARHHRRDRGAAHRRARPGLPLPHRGGVDGLAGEEGTFLLCTFWLAQALALAGQVERARAVFERRPRFVNDVGLLAEEVDPDTGELLGNFPQAFSHIGLVNAAWAIAEADPARHGVTAGPVAGTERGAASRCAPLPSTGRARAETVAHPAIGGLPMQLDPPAAPGLTVTRPRRCPPPGILQVDDSELVDRLRAGDERAFAEVVSSWSPMMLRVARGHVSTDASCEEIVQETWMAVVRGLDALRGPVVPAHLGVPHPHQPGQDPRGAGGAHGADVVLGAGRRLGSDRRPGPVPRRRRPVPAQLDAGGRPPPGSRAPSSRSSRARSASCSARRLQRAAGTPAHRGHPARRARHDGRGGLQHARRQPGQPAGAAAPWPRQAPGCPGGLLPQPGGGVMIDPSTPGMTISCQEVVEIVTDYLEGDLDDPTRVELEAHLALCPGCETYLEQMRATIDRLGHVPVETLSDQAQADLMAAFRTFHVPADGSG